MSAPEPRRNDHQKVSATQPAIINPSTRLASLDALRGFDMFWILGMEEVARELGKASDSWFARFFATQLDHVPWEGFHFLDLIFPLFVFIAGVSITLSLRRSLAEQGRRATLRKLAVRCLILFLLGILLYGGISGGLEKVRLLGVLQRIALAAFCAGTIYCFTSWRGQVAWFVGLLLAYWALLTFVPVPGVGAGHFAEGENLTNYLDRMWLPFRKWDGDHDPEGLLSTLPAVATCLLGVLTGVFLQRDDLTPRQKTRWLFVAGVALVAAGWLWGVQFPVIKKIWTSSYVLVAGGYSCLLLGAFYGIIEVAGWRRWATPFIWIGMNAITLYVLNHFVPFEKLASALVGGPRMTFFGASQHVVIAVVVVGLNIALARFLFVRKIFLRV
jgi:predicted acyltransferase